MGMQQQVAKSSNRPTLMPLPMMPFELEIKEENAVKFFYYGMEGERIVKKATKDEENHTLDENEKGEKIFKENGGLELLTSKIEGNRRAIEEEKKVEKNLKEKEGFKTTKEENRLFEAEEKLKNEFNKFTL
jgi:polysaccharide deacetylase 2 family uncharacterized protein YibQ